MDLTKDTVLGDRLSQVAGGTGFDHNFCMGQSGAMKHVARWCNSNNMSLNVSKTKFMYISSRHKQQILANCDHDISM